MKEERFVIEEKKETECCGHGDYREETYFYVCDTKEESYMFPGKVVCRFEEGYHGIADQVLEYLNNEF